MSGGIGVRRWLAILAGLLCFSLLPSTPYVLADDIPLPAEVVLAGSLQSEVSTCADWDPGCDATRLTLVGNGVYRRAFNLPPGNYAWKIALGSWDENYGYGGRNGSDFGLDLSSKTSSTEVIFYYDHKTHGVTNSYNGVVATVAGSFQSEIGCPGDWQPDCVLSLLSDPNSKGELQQFTSEAIPPGDYAFKVALNERWDTSYPGSDVFFTVPPTGARVHISYNPADNAVAVTVTPLVVVPAPDNNILWDGLRHDSRDTLYRSPGGAVIPGTSFILRFRTFHNDVTSVKLRVYDTAQNQELFLPMSLAASDVDCYGNAPAGYSCDFWEATVSAGDPGTWYYRFIVRDGSATAYYADDTQALDGAAGAVTDGPRDWSYVVTVYDPAELSTPIRWMQDAVSYQIFPDRFRNGNPANDWQDGEPRYDDPVIQLDWGTLPEGYCRAYDGANNQNCPWRFGEPPAWGVNLPETPRGRDYYGGDLRGVIQQLDYLQRLGVTVIYFNPIFAASSNHRYDTRDYYRIAPELGSMADWNTLVRESNRRGIKIILDGVFNHLSSDSPFFDRYQRYGSLGACESVDSPYNDWFVFRAPRPGESVQCPNRPAGQTNYDGWFGFDSIPVINKSNPDVLDYFVNSNASVTRFWLERGASGWRQDVMGDPSFPDGYWEAFRDVVKQTNPNAIIIGELWKKDENLNFNHGDRADGSMNYRLRDAVLGFIGTGDPTKGFPDGGRSFSASEFASRMLSIQEDYSAGYYFQLMNLLGSHDTERMIWNLTPGGQNRADKEFNSANLAIGLQRAQLASLLQFSMPGAPQIYYGDEVGVTGDDDPDDRRSFPWPDTGGTINTALLEHYTALGRMRAKTDSLRRGDLTWLLADNAAQTVAFGRKYRNEATIVVVNRSDSAQTVSIPLAGFVPDGLNATLLYSVAGAGQSTTITNGAISQNLPARSGAVLLVRGDLTPTRAPGGLSVTDEGQGRVSLSWNAVSGATGYNIYRSPVSRGGWVLVGTTQSSSFDDTGLRNGRNYYYVVRTLDSLGNQSGDSNEVRGLPRYSIGWANLQWPFEINHTISASTSTAEIYGQIWIDGVTGNTNPVDGLRAQLGYGPRNSNPATSPDWVWVDASFNGFSGNNNEFVATLRPDMTGEFDYTYRYSTSNGEDWVYADRDGIDGYDSDRAGKLSVNGTGDTSAPTAPGNLRSEDASTASIDLAWDAASDNVAVYGYEVLRAPAGGTLSVIATVVGTTSYSDTSVDEGASYDYAVRALDESFNRSGLSNQITATAERRLVSVTFTVTVPAGTPAGSTVYIAGQLNRLEPAGPEWNPGGQALTQIGANTWQVTLTGRESTQIAYKYTLGSWDFVEKSTGCAEISDRSLTIAFGSNGQQQVNDSVANWRNVSPCGN